MAKLPVEIVRIGHHFNKEIEDVISLINDVQKEIQYSILQESDEVKFQLLEFKEALASDILEKVKIIRRELKGFHPFLIVISNIKLAGKEYLNIFGEAHPEEGVAIFTFSNIPDIIIPSERIKSYIAYFISRYTFNFLIPSHRNHIDTRKCVFDKKIEKTDLIASMKAGAICDGCRAIAMSSGYNLSAAQFVSLNLIFGKAEELYSQDVSGVELKAKKSKIFIGSSTEGLGVARKIQAELHTEFDVVIWNQGIFERLGLSFLEILVETVNVFDYGIFVLTPDDNIESRGQTKTITRDNVIFEMGMFVGKLGRKKTFLIHPQRMDLHILTDFEGITKATYDPSGSNLQAALGPVCEKIRTSISQI